ncbi:DUF1398 domain-containing protein [Pedobacter cryoconitis]|uniref:Uncharacterized protein YbcV (DUF1398 family) n=1 Tax=Pedobacter cryoconitis TaxID=188932 RepID=A0A7X0MKX6_9SPHI|nr:DUF1398 family protein [Pedobacter cryoconitis]MBB6502997.1 uncharacterized protein YbcV (DUF1398 family) [Pedobacter cryoconitis]
MFTEQQLKAAHAKVKTGTDFPAYIQEIKKAGLTFYEFWVKDGHTTYHGSAGHRIESAPVYDPLKISNTSSVSALKHTIAIHQLGQTDFSTFCFQAASAGVEKWVIDTDHMICTYYDRNGASLVAEPIPDAGY